MDYQDIFAAGKYYYSIREVAEALQVKASQIRYWEKEFSILNPKKNKKGDRRFAKKDIEILRLIIHLLKEKKFTIEGAKAYIAEQKDTISADMEAIKHLETARERLQNLVKYL